MPKYIDGFLIPVPAKNLPQYEKIARIASKVWRDHGALEYRECVGEDLAASFGVPFPRQLKVRRGETVVFSWIVFKSRTHRDRVNAKAMSDPRLAKCMDPKTTPFDVSRMLYGGFRVMVDA